MEILLILSSKSYCFPLYNVAVPVDDSFDGYGLFPVIDDRIAKAWFHFHSPKSLFHCNDVCCSFEFELLSSFQLIKERIVNIHFSNDSLWMKALLESCPFHSWKYTTVLLSFHAIQFLVLVPLCIWRWQSIIDPITVVSLTHLSFPTKGFAFDQQCASPNSTIKWVKVMKSITCMIKAIHYRCWMLIERICTNTIITAIAIDPLFSYQTSSTSSQYNNNHLHVSLILEFPFVNDCTLRTHQISLSEYCKTPADIGLSIQSKTSPTFSIPEYLVDDRLKLVHWLLDADALSLWFTLSSDIIRSEENDGIVNEWYYCILHGGIVSNESME